MGLFAKTARRLSRRLSKRLPDKREGIPGPSDNPATNFLLADVVIRAGGYLARRGFEKRLLSNRYGRDTAHRIVENKSLGQTFLSFALARVASKSVPGAILVGGGALAKALLDRRKSRLRSKVEGDAQLLQQAADE